ncbi:leucine-rich repeat-containing protein kinase family protein [Oxalobacteraceae bacterium A2-2]
MHTLEEIRCGALAGTRRLTLRCGLTAFPPEIYTLADSLEILDLSGNALSSLPDDLPRLHKLRIVFCSDNLFTELPAVLGRCPNLSMIGFKANRIRSVPAAALPPQLRWLTLTDNAIEELPPELGRCTRLQKLMLAGNRLRALPPELANCTRLELLRIAANRFDALPPWLLALPRLSWLACAGNPFADAAVPPAASATIAWNSLRLRHRLGEGASGVIYQALWDDGVRQREVAVKLFKGAVTSDGLPASEMAACVAAGAHPHLIPVLGTLAGHPDGTPGMVMPLIDPAYTNLAGPPSLDSCTRDVYPDGKRFSLDALLEIAHGIASAARHLHQRGILHGDLYAHNTLHTEEGLTLLGDFGAASFYARDGVHAQGLQALEVRAYGCLLEELLQRCEAGAVAPVLLQLQAECLQEEASLRPPFEEIERRLRSLA